MGMNDIPIWVAVLGGLFGLGSILLRSRFDRQSANLAILAETYRLQNIIKRHLDFWKANLGARPLLALTTPVFDVQLQNIGMVDRKVVANVVKFYGYIKFVNGVQAERMNFAAPEEFNSLYTTVLTNLHNDFKDSFTSVYQKFGLL
jgi:hypothetical protein